LVGEGRGKELRTIRHISGRRRSMTSSAARQLELSVAGLIEQAEQRLGKRRLYCTHG
jgi:hypothetical protein